jgi:rare lipoprotein A
MFRILLLITLAGYFIAEEKQPDAVSFKGQASYYGAGFDGRKTANGEIYNRYLYTAAHRKLPFNTYLQITNLKNQLSITVRINDRGPYNYNRVIDLSESAARRIGSYKHGLTVVSAKEMNLIRHTPEIDSIFTCTDVLDCLGNEDDLKNYSLQLYRTNDLIHTIYLANELYLHEDVDKVYIVGKGIGEKRLYSIVTSNYKTQKDAIIAKDYFEKKGFMEVKLFR